jgi:hypothetical protein
LCALDAFATMLTWLFELQTFKVCICRAVMSYENTRADGHNATFARAATVGDLFPPEVIPTK